MKPALRRPPRWQTAWLAAGLVLALVASARAQLTTQDEERLRILSDPDAIKKKLDEKKNRPPFEFFKSQVAPFDVLPFVKAHHWSTLTLEMRANDEDYDGFLQTDPVPLVGMPIEMVYRRDARLVKEQRRALGQQVLLTRIPKEWTLTLRRPGACAATRPGRPSSRRWSPHQTLVLVLSKEATTSVRDLEPDDGHDPHGDGPRGYADARSPAILPPGPARRAGQAGAVAPPAGLDDDQPRDLGRPAAGCAVGLAAAGPAGLAALGGPVDLHRRRGAVVLRSTRRASWAPTCRASRPARRSA